MNFFASSDLYHVHLGDCVEHMATLPDACFDFAIYSVPFPALFSYTSEAADIGNSEEIKHEAKAHFSFFYRQFRRVMKPGRVVIVHVMQIPRMKRTGGRGLNDFRGLNIRVGERAGLIYDYDWLIRKNPQAQAVRTKSHNLQFAGLERDRANSRGALCDYLIKFLVPGENAVPVNSVNQVSRDNWIDWAEGSWGDIKETDTLNRKNGYLGHRDAGSEDDVKHICPLQIPVIDRVVRLYTNPGEIVFSPFAGIGSEGVVALKLGRRFYGCELKQEYHEAALHNLAQAVHQHEEDSKTLFDMVEAKPEKFKFSTREEADACAQGMAANDPDAQYEVEKIEDGIYIVYRDGEAAFVPPSEGEHK